MEWLKQNYDVTRYGPPTWKALVDAVGHSAGGNNRAEAEGIASRHRASEYVFSFTIVSYLSSILLLDSLALTCNGVFMNVRMVPSIPFLETQQGVLFTKEKKKCCKYESMTSLKEQLQWMAIFQGIKVSQMFF